MRVLEYGVVGKYGMGVVGIFINENDIFINENTYPPSCLSAAVRLPVHLS